jgi:hypothetical protein
LVSAVAASAIFAGIVLILPLVVSGHLPPRGLVTGSVAYGRWVGPGTYGNSTKILISLYPVPDTELIFDHESGPDRYRTIAYAGVFSITVPAGSYRIEAGLPIGPAAMYYVDSASAGPAREIRSGPFSVAAGEHVILHLLVDPLGQ